MKTPFETNSKGALFGNTFGESAAVKATLTAITRSGSMMHPGGINLDWMAEQVTKAYPQISGVRARILAYGAVMQEGKVISLRRVQIRRPAGFPVRTLDPVRGWL